MTVSHCAVGGFIQPNDHVDIIVTATIAGDSGERVTSNIVAADIRVLALGETTQAQTSGGAPERIEARVAVLELTSGDARALELADELGDISLALRGVQVETVGMGEPSSREGQPSGAVLVHAFGTVSGGGR